MKIILTSSLGGTRKVDGKRVPAILNRENGLLDCLQSVWMPDAKVLMVCADPENAEKNDSLCACLQEAFPMSGLPVSSFEICDGRNPEIIAGLRDADVLILTGGHVPTQNAFMKQLRLKERLSDFCGIVVAWSAGAMNCAANVYASPELDGEALDPMYERWITGLGLTKINVFPHFQMLRYLDLDGLRVIEDIALPDSMGHAFIALHDGSYIDIDGDRATVHGEAYRIADGRIHRICSANEAVILL